MKRSFFAIILLLGLPLSACGPDGSSRQADAAEQSRVLEGAWRRTEVFFEAGPNAGTHTLDVQPSIYIFSKSHYAIAAVDGFAPRPYLSENPTPEEAGRAFEPLIANTGTYRNEEGKLTLSPLVAKNPAQMNVATKMEYDVSWVDQDLWLVTTTPENGELRTRLTRLADNPTRPTPDARRLQGVWRRAEMIIGGGPYLGTHLADMQPGYYIFTPNYFVANYVSAFAPRPPLSEKPTDAERGNVFTPFVDFAGTYVVTDGELMFTPIVSKTPNNMRGRPFQPVGMEWVGNDVWFIFTGVDGSQNRTRLTPIAD
jgi:hypothetical protein